MSVVPTPTVSDGAAQAKAGHHGARVSLLHPSDRPGVRLPAQEQHHSPRLETRQSLHERRHGDKDWGLWTGHAGLIQRGEEEVSDAVVLWSLHLVWLIGVGTQEGYSDMPHGHGYQQRTSNFSK